MIGEKELKGKFNSYGENTQANANKPSTAPVNKTKENFRRQKVEKPINFDKENFKRDLGNFHSAIPGFMQEVDFKAIQKGCKPNLPPRHTTLQVEDGQKKAYGRNSKKFYGIPLSERSEMSRAKHAFYGTNDIQKPRPGTVQSSARKEMTTQEMIDEYQKNSQSKNRSTTPDLVNIEKTQHYKRDAANFYGQSYKSSEKGSIFQDNTAEFYGVEKPPHGVKIIDVNQKNFSVKQPKKTSVLNQKRLQKHEVNMQRHPMFGKHLKRFYGLKSTGNPLC